MKRQLVSLTIAIAASTVSTMALSTRAQGEDWPMWRGPRGDGVSLESKAPMKWSTTENVRWKTKIAGVGRSSPIVVGDSVFVTAFDTTSQSRQLFRVDKESGKVVWATTVHTAPSENQHKFNTSASATPASDGKLVFTVFVDDKQLVVAATDWKGEVVWKKFLGTYFSRHGFAASPVLCDEGLIINGHQDGDAFVSLLTPSTGEEVWRYKPETNLRSFSTPLVGIVDGQRQIVLAGANQTLGLDPKTGERIWFVAGPSEKVVCSPSIGLGHVFSFGGSPAVRACAIKQDGLKNESEQNIIWKTEKGMPYVPTPVLYGERFHIVDDLGIYTCLDPITGKVLKALRKSGNTYSSPIGVADRVYLFDDSGTCTIIANNNQYEVLAKNSLDEVVQTTPAFSDGSMYIRSEDHLWRIEE